MNRIFPEYKQIVPLPDYGVGCFMVVSCYEIDILKNRLTLKGVLYEVNQNTVEPEKQGLYEVDCPFNVQSILECKEAKDELEN